MVAAALAWHVIGACVVLCTGLCGVALPTAIQRHVAARRRTSAGGDGDGGGGGGVLPLGVQCAVRLLLAVGGGVILTTGTIHILPEARGMLSEARALRNTNDSSGDGGGDNDGYPVAELIVSGVIFFFYVVENELTIFLLKSRRSEAAAAGDATAATEAADLARASVAATGGSGFGGYPPGHSNADRATLGGEAAACEAAEEKAAAARLIKVSVTTHVLEIGVAVHSLVVGFSLGMQSELNDLRTLVVAICFHQFCEGVAIGASVGIATGGLPNR